MINHHHQVISHRFHKIEAKPFNVVICFLALAKVFLKVPQLTTNTNGQQNTDSQHNERLTTKKQKSM